MRKHLLKALAILSFILLNSPHHLSDTERQENFCPVVVWLCFGPEHSCCGLDIFEIGLACFCRSIVVGSFDSQDQVWPADNDTYRSVGDRVFPKHNLTPEINIQKAVGLHKCSTAYLFQAFAWPRDKHNTQPTTNGKKTVFRKGGRGNGTQSVSHASSRNGLPGTSEFLSLCRDITAADDWACEENKALRGQTP